MLKTSSIHVSSPSGSKHRNTQNSLLTKTCGSASPHIYTIVETQRLSVSQQIARVKPVHE
uniref:Uncharacterized protein n=1 Tax=Rhizophora mucronata TaxID=61149 RepID=A0A2P2JX30_RHIMU